MLAASGDSEIARQLMRHSDINLLSRHTHVFRGQEAEAINALPDLDLRLLIAKSKREINFSNKK